jgi:Bacterial extracellular solute-binding protein, family 7
MHRLIGRGYTDVVGRRPFQVLRYNSAQRVDEVSGSPYRGRASAAAEQNARLEAAGHRRQSLHLVDAHHQRELLRLGLRYRMTGPGAEVLRRMGATVVVVPGGEIIQTLKSGAIHGSEWVGPWLATALGLHTAAGYYYYPGFHEPGTNIAVGINKGVWGEL